MQYCYYVPRAIVSTYLNCRTYSGPLRCQLRSHGYVNGQFSLMLHINIDLIVTMSPYSLILSFINAHHVEFQKQQWAMVVEEGVGFKVTPRETLTLHSFHIYTYIHVYIRT